MDNRASTTLDFILNEYFQSREDNGVFFDLAIKDDFNDFKRFLAEGKSNSSINEITLTNILTSTINFIKTKFVSLVDRISDKINQQKYDSEIEVTIPHVDIPEPQSLDTIIGKESIDEGAIESIKGNYNEVLTCKRVIEKNKTPIKLYIINRLNEEKEKNDGNIIVVDLDSDGVSKSSQINELVKRWDEKLKIAAKDNYLEILNVIKLASKDMAEYIIESVGTNGGTIVAIWLVNTEYLKGAENKADIKLRIKKGGDEFFKNFSLKMYSSHNVNLINSTLISSIKNWCGPDAANSIKSTIMQNLDLQKMMELQRKLDNLVQKSKLNPPPKDFKINADEAYKECIRQKFITTISPSIKYTTDGLRATRGNVREKINPILADYLYEFLKKFISKPENRNYFIKHFLISIGFSDNDTDFILAVVGAKQIHAQKSLIINEYPELNFDNMKLEHNTGTVIIRIINDDKMLARLGFKEGQYVTGQVNFI